MNPIGAEFLTLLKALPVEIARQDIDPTFIAEEIEVRGEVGYVVGTSHATIYPHDGSPSKEVNFRALWLMKKDEDIWKIDRQIWNVKPS